MIRVVMVPVAVSCTENAAANSLIVAYAPKPGQRAFSAE
jgi:hypothetical protein